MKYKKLLLLTLISVFIFIGSSFAAGTSSEGNVSKYEKLYNKGALLIKQGKKLEKKDKIVLLPTMTMYEEKVMLKRFRHYMRSDNKTKNKN